MHDHVARRWNGVAPIQAVIGVLCLLCIGCNPYHRPMNLEPASEVKKSNQFVKAGRTTIHIPDGWTILNIARDDAGIPGHVHMKRSDREGDLVFTAQQHPPDWLNSESKKSSTDRYSDVPYWIEKEREASGDDTPGAFAFQAFVVTPDKSWEMFVSFPRPVRPNLRVALQYIDALEYDESQDVAR